MLCFRLMLAILLLSLLDLCNWSLVQLKKRYFNLVLLISIH